VSKNILQGPNHLYKGDDVVPALSLTGFLKTDKTFSRESVLRVDFILLKSPIAAAAAAPAPSSKTVGNSYFNENLAAATTIPDGLAGGGSIRLSCCCPVQLLLLLLLLHLQLLLRLLSWLLQRPPLL
jgi:hypothetical protein